MSKMPALFEVKIEDTDEKKASEFISKLQKQGFVTLNKVYLQNYINADIGIAFAHIKNNYKTYVIKGGWSEEKFEDVINVIIRHRKMLIPNVFLRYGMMYDDGKISHEARVERMKYEAQSKAEKEREELLKYMRENGGVRQ